MPSTARRTARHPGTLDRAFPLSTSDNRVREFRANSYSPKPGRRQTRMEDNGNAILQITRRSPESCRHTLYDWTRYRPCRLVRTVRPGEPPSLTLPPIVGSSNLIAVGSVPPDAF